jgi:hypothetical protein
MNRTQALIHLRAMLFAVQKTRSILSESMGEDATAQAVNADLSPWLFGPRSVLPALIKYLDRVEAGGPISGADFYNFMSIAARTPAIIVEAAIGDSPLPEPDFAWYGQVWK